MRVVLDTNVWISGLLIPESKAGSVLNSWRQGHLSIVTSLPIIQEIREVLLYPKISKRLKWDKIKINHYVDLLSFFTENIDIKKLSVEVKKDPKDSAILETLIMSHCDYLVTGDKVLLELSNLHSIISLAEFYNILFGFPQNS